MYTVIFVPDIIEYAFLEVSLSDKTFMGGEYSNESRNAFYYCLRSSNNWYMHHYLTPKKHVFNYFVLGMAAVIVASRGTAEMRECVVEGRIFIFPHIIYLECKNI